MKTALPGFELPACRSAIADSRLPTSLQLQYVAQKTALAGFPHVFPFNMVLNLSQKDNLTLVFTKKNVVNLLRRT